MWRIFWNKCSVSEDGDETQNFNLQKGLTHPEQLPQPGGERVVCRFDFNLQMFDGLTDFEQLQAEIKPVYVWNHITISSCVELGAGRRV